MSAERSAHRPTRSRPAFRIDKVAVSAVGAMVAAVLVSILVAVVQGSVMGIVVLAVSVLMVAFAAGRLVRAGSLSVSVVGG